MKEVKAIIQPYMLSDVLKGLAQLKDLPAVTTSDVVGHSVKHASCDCVKKMKLEIMVPDDKVDAVVDTIAQFAKTGKPGDGRIFVYNLESTVKIRTGEKGTFD